MLPFLYKVQVCRARSKVGNTTCYHFFTKFKCVELDQKSAIPLAYVSAPKPRITVAMPLEKAINWLKVHNEKHDESLFNSVYKNL